MCGARMGAFGVGLELLVRLRHATTCVTRLRTQGFDPPVEGHNYRSSSPCFQALASSCVSSTGALRCD